MALRYNRRILPDLLSDEDVDAFADKLFALIDAKIHQFLKPEHGWALSDSDSHQIEAVNGSITCKARLRSDVDMHASGERFRYIQISMSSMNHKRAESDQAEVDITQGFEKTFALIGSGVLGVPAFLVQAVAIKRISLQATAVAFVIGYLLGGLTGYMIGSGVGATAKHHKGKMSFDDEVDFGVAKDDWERFLADITPLLDEFAQGCESTPSSAAIA